MAKLKFTLNKLAKQGFKFTETREKYYTCNLQNNQVLSFHAEDGEIINNAFCCSGFYTNSRGEILEAVSPSKTFFYGINSVIRTFANEIIK